MSQTVSAGISQIMNDGCIWIRFICRGQMTINWWISNRCEKFFGRIIRNKCHVNLWCASVGCFLSLSHTLSHSPYSAALHCSHTLTHSHHFQFISCVPTLSFLLFSILFYFSTVASLQCWTMLPFQLLFNQWFLFDIVYVFCDFVAVDVVVWYCRMSLLRRELLLIHSFIFLWNA